MAQVKTYSGAKVLVSFADRRLQGLGDGDFVSVVPVSNMFESYVGTDGTVSRSATNDPRATATLTLAQTSEANDTLSQLAALDRAAANGEGVARFQLQDLGGTTLVEGPAWIERMPDAAFGRAVGTRGWVFLIAVETWTIGGNS